jgi:hypothetical protein
MREAHHVDNYEQLLDRVETLNQEYVEPMQQAEVTKIAKSAWGITERGDNRFGQHGSWSPVDEINRFREDQNAFWLLSFLRADNHPDSTFMVANGLAEAFGWTRNRLAAARESIIRQGYIRRLRHASNNSPALYRWLPRPKQAESMVLVEDRWSELATPTLAQIRQSMGYRQ